MTPNPPSQIAARVMRLTPNMRVQLMQIGVDRGFEIRELLIARPSVDFVIQGSIGRILNGWFSLCIKRARLRSFGLPLLC